MIQTRGVKSAPAPRTAVPRHVAIIMDGNGRWARGRGLPRLAGHRAGVENIRPILRECANLGIECVTLFAFSTENWLRPAEEVQGLMAIMNEFIDREGRALHEEGVRIRHLGQLDGIPAPLGRKIDELVELTRRNDRLTVAVAMNYGGRLELVHAMRAMAAEGLHPDEIDEHAIELRLTTSGMPDPDLIIRTSGESRLSNFLIWQAAYSEYWTTPTFWPDFGPSQLRDALAAFGKRDRRFGRVTPCQESFSNLGALLADVARGVPVLIVDAEDRENEGDLMVAAEHATPDVINFFATHARGLVCVPMLGRRLADLDLPLMVPPGDGREAAFTVSVDAAAGGSGISTVDRAGTIAALIDPGSTRSDLRTPGHVFPLRAAEGGVLAREGHTEAAIELASMSGRYPAAVICEVLNGDGSMARRDDLARFAQRHSIKAISIAAIIDARRRIG